MKVKIKLIPVDWCVSFNYQPHGSELGSSKKINNKTTHCVIKDEIQKWNSLCRCHLMALQAKKLV